MRSINGYGNWTTFDGTGEFGFGTGGYVGVGGDGGSYVAGAEFACVGTGGCVGVGLFGVDAVVADDVVEGLVH